MFVGLEAIQAYKNIPPLPSLKGKDIEHEVNCLTMGGHISDFVIFLTAHVQVGAGRQKQLDHPINNVLLSVLETWTRLF
jgi:hypothetical protein